MYMIFFVIFAIILVAMYIAIRRRLASPTIIGAPLIAMGVARLSRVTSGPPGQGGNISS